MLRRVDGQLFGDALNDLCHRLARIVTAVRAEAPKRARLVVGGAGTSARVAHLAVRRARLMGVDATYAAAGGDGALIAAQEKAEDGVNDVQLPQRDESAVTLVVGVSCGLVRLTMRLLHFEPTLHKTHD